MQAVIMAGGEGTRLRPLTCNLPKPMVPILNAPMMEHIVNLLKRHGYTNIASTLWYLPQEITDYFRDGRDFGVKMNYFVETTPLGTAGSVKSASLNFRDTFLVVSGDALTDMDLSSAVAFHKEKRAVATLVLTRVANPLGYGVVLFDQNGKITQFLEKPSWSQVFSDTVNTGIYILEPEALDLVPPGQKVDFSRDVFPKLLQMGAPLYGFVAQGYWSDVGSLPAYSQALQDCLDGKVFLELPKASSRGIYFEEGVELSPDAKLEGPLFLSRGCKVGPNSYIGPYTIMGAHCQIGKDVSLKQSVLWQNVQVGERSHLRGTICAKNVQLQTQVELYEGSVLGEKVQVGTMSSIAPDVKVWPHKKVKSGTSLRRSLVWGGQERASLFSQDGIKGDYRGDLTPEAIVEVGLSLASFYGGQGEVLVTSDHTIFGELVKEALILGLRSGGVHVCDGGAVAGLFTRLMVQELGLLGAFHCQHVRNSQGKIEINCWNALGRPFSKVDENKIENIFLREDFARPDQVRFGKRENRFIAPLGYLKTLAQTYPAGRSEYEVGLVTTVNSQLGTMVADFLRLAGYTVQTTKPVGVPTVVVGEERWFFQDEQGTPISDDVLWRIFVNDLGTKGQDQVAIPINRSQIVAKEAQRAGLKVEWTGQEPSYWMEIASELGNTVQTTGGEVFPQIEPIARIGGVLSYLSKHNVPLSDFHSSTFQKQQDVPCTWESKGRVMRKLIENSNPEKTLYLDGIREQMDSGWVLIVPHGDEPIFKVQTESDCEARAIELLEHYVGLIKSYGNEE